MGTLTPEDIERARLAKQRQIAARERAQGRALGGPLARPRPTLVPLPPDPSMYTPEDLYELGVGPGVTPFPRRKQLPRARGFQLAVPQATSKPPPMLSVEEFLAGDPTQEQVTQYEEEQYRRRGEPIRRFVRGAFTGETMRRLAGAGTYLAQTLGLPGEDIRQRVDDKRALGMSISDATQEVWLEGTGWPSVDIAPAVMPPVRAAIGAFTPFTMFPSASGPTFLPEAELEVGWQGLAEVVADPINFIPLSWLGKTAKVAKVADGIPGLPPGIRRPRGVVGEAVTPPTAPPVTPGGDILPTRVRDAIVRVRKAVEEGVEDYRVHGPREEQVGGIPEREIPTGWRAGVDPQLESMGMRRVLPTEEMYIPDVQLEMAMEFKADWLGGLAGEMEKRGVKLTNEVRGELEAAQALLNEPGKRAPALLFDAIARRHGGKSIANEFDILDDIRPHELGETTEAGKRLDLNRFAADWDARGRPDIGGAASRDAEQIASEVESLLYRPPTAARGAPARVVEEGAEGVGAPLGAGAPGTGGNTQKLSANVGSRAEAQANIAKEVFEPVEGSRIDEAATAYLRASKEGEEAISAAGAVDLTDPIGQYSRRITDNYNKYIRGMGPPSKDFPVSLALITQPMRNIGRWIRYMTDPTRMLQAIDQGVFGDAVQRYVLWPTRRTDIASKHFAKAHTILYRKIQDQYGMVDSLAQQLTPGIGPLRDVKRAKMLRSLAGDVLEEISYNDVNVPVVELLSRPSIARWLTKITFQEKERVVGFAQRTRIFFDDLLVKQNQARVARGQDPIGYIENYRPWVAESNIWSKIGFGKQTSAQLAAKKELPDFVTPKAWFNPRAQIRREGMVDYWKERDLQILAGDYVETASKDIFYTNIIQNAKPYIKQLRSRKGLGGAARGVEQWIMESYAGTKPPISKFAISAEETVGRVVKGVTRGKVAGGIPIRRGMFAVRKNLTRAVFPFNWSWNLATQTASTAGAFMRYGIVRTLQGFGYITNAAIKREVRNNTYSLRVKMQRGGKAVYQDTGVGTMAQIERTPIEKAEDLANFITNTLEDNLTGISAQAARKEAESLGLTGRALWEYASEGGAKTQSMYNLADMPGLLRAPEVGSVAPFQTFAFDMMNNVLEAMPLVPGRARVGAYAGVRLPSGQVVSTAMSGTTQNRLKALGRWVAGITAFAMASDYALGRQPWRLGSFLPFYGLLLEGYVAGNPFNKPLPTKYAYDFTKAIQAYTKYGDWKKLRTWFIGYHVLGGTQFNRTIKGIEAVAEGKVTDVRGETLFDTEPPEGWASGRGIWEAFKAVTQGPYAVTDGRAYVEELKGGLVEEYIGDWPRAVLASLGTWTESEEAKARRAVDRFTLTLGGEETNYPDLYKHPFVRRWVKEQLPSNLRDSVDEYIDADYAERRELIRTQDFRDIRDAVAEASRPGGMLYYLRGEFSGDAPYGWKLVAASVGRTFPAINGVPSSDDFREFILEWEEEGKKVPEYDYDTWSVVR